LIQQHITLQYQGQKPPNLLDVARQLLPHQQQQGNININRAVDFGAAHRKWEHLEGVDIIRDCLINGNFTQGLTYLRFRESTAANASGSKSNSSQHIMSYDEVLKVAYCIVYQAIMRNQIDLAATMLNNIGEDAGHHMKEVAFGTSRRAIRRLLIDYLHTKDVPLSDKERAAIGIKNSLSLSLSRSRSLAR
jgi:hypothetical protein